MDQNKAGCFHPAVYLSLSRGVFVGSSGWKPDVEERRFQGIRICLRHTGAISDNLDGSKKICFVFIEGKKYFRGSMYYSGTGRGWGDFGGVGGAVAGISRRRSGDRLFAAVRGGGISVLHGRNCIPASVLHTGSNSVSSHDGEEQTDGTKIRSYVGSGNTMVHFALSDFSVYHGGGNLCGNLCKLKFMDESFFIKIFNPYSYKMW